MTLKEQIIQAQLPQRTLLMFAIRALTELDGKKADEEGVLRPSLVFDFSAVLFHTNPKGEELYEEFEYGIREQTQAELKEFAMQCLEKV